MKTQGLVGSSKDPTSFAKSKNGYCPPPPNLKHVKVSIALWKKKILELAYVVNTVTLIVGYMAI